MVFTGAIGPKRRAYIAFLTRDKRVRTMDIVKRCKVSRATVYRIKKPHRLDQAEEHVHERRQGQTPKEVE